MGIVPVVVNVIVEDAVTVRVVVTLAIIIVFVGTGVGAEVLVGVCVEVSGAKVFVAVEISSGPSGRTLVFLEQEKIASIISAVAAADIKKPFFISSPFFHGSGAVEMIIRPLCGRAV
jgi:hypothetical protein